MTETDLKTIEQSLGFALPGFYRDSVLEYPFAPDSFGCEFMLPDSSQEVIELNAAGVEIEGLESLFFIGSDGGEQWYFLDPDKSESQVHVFHLETGLHQVLDSHWEGYLQRIKAANDEVEADEEAETQGRLDKKWYEFWK